MESFKNEVARLRQRYKTLQQQQMTFVAGLDNSRTDQYERCKPLRSINEVWSLNKINQGGELTSNQKLTYFVLYLKIMNTFLKTNLCILLWIVQEIQKVSKFK